MSPPSPAVRRSASTAWGLYGRVATSISAYWASRWRRKRRPRNAQNGTRNARGGFRRRASMRHSDVRLDPMSKLSMSMEIRRVSAGVTVSARIPRIRSRTQLRRFQKSVASSYPPPNRIPAKLDSFHAQIQKRAPAAGEVDCALTDVRDRAGYHLYPNL